MIAVDMGRPPCRRSSRCLLPAAATAHVKSLTVLRPPPTCVSLLRATRRYRVWAAYNKLLAKQPLLVKACTSFVGFTAGDVLAQNVSVGWRGVTGLTG